MCYYVILFFVLLQLDTVARYRTVNLTFIHSFLSKQQVDIGSISRKT